MSTEIASEMIAHHGGKAAHKYSRIMFCSVEVRNLVHRRHKWMKSRTIN